MGRAVGWGGVWRSWRSIIGVGRCAKSAEEEEERIGANWEGMGRGARSAGEWGREEWGRVRRSGEEWGEFEGVGRRGVEWKWKGVGRI